MKPVTLAAVVVALAAAVGSFYLGRMTRPVSMASGPSRTVSMSAAPVGGSPEAAKPMVWCDPSQ